MSRFTDPNVALRLAHYAGPYFLQAVHPLSEPSISFQHCSQHVLLTVPKWSALRVSTLQIQIVDAMPFGSASGPRERGSLSKGSSLLTHFRASVRDSFAKR